ncbi:MAG TPA: AMP-binding protein [Acidobacteriota bacterium]|nr:AMP-binding protein [Acidobacteriota bacterium]
MHLENRLHRHIESMLQHDGEFRGYMGGELPARVTRVEIDKYRFFQLRRILDYVGEKSSFYRELYRSAGVVPGDIRSLADLARLPLTEPEHIAEQPYRFLCLSLAHVARVYTFVTSGTTGPRKKIFWTDGDIERIIDFMSAGIGAVAGPDDTVEIYLPDGKLYSQADLLRRGVEKIGARPVIAGMDFGVEEHLALLEKFHAAVLFGYTSRIYRLTRELQARCDPGVMGVKVLFLAGEYVPPAMRRELAEIWNCRLRTHYGLTEMGLGVAVECEAGDGYHFNEADLLVEIVDPATGAPVEAGREGELVFTTLTREAMPLIRYRTRDISRLITQPCSCGAAGMMKFAAVRKRAGNIVTVGAGGEIYPACFDDELFSVGGMVDYRVTATRAEDCDRLDFQVELAPWAGGGERAAEISNKLFENPVIADNVRAGSMLQPHIEIVPPGSLKLSDRAKKMVVDRR